MNARIRRIARRLPESTQRLLRRLDGSPRVKRLVRPVRFGSLRHPRPISHGWGAERGTPVDRYYIDRFFESQSGVIRGRVLEVRDPRYASLGKDITQLEIVDIDPRNDGASIVADLAEPGSLPAASFDCAIVPQTLVYVSDLDVAVANLWQSIAPGGSLLVTTPAIARVDPAAAEQDRWHLMPAGLEAVLRRSCPAGTFAVRGHGNVLAAIAFLHGLAQEDLNQRDLERHDPLYPIVVSASVRKPV